MATRVLRVHCLLLALAVVPPLAADEPKGPPEGWKEYTPSDKSFTVWLPDKGGKSSERNRTLTIKGNRVRIDFIQLEANGGPTYGAATLILPLKMARGVKANERVEIMRDAFVDEVKGKITKETDIKQGKVPGKEYMIETPKGVARLQVYAAGSRLYRVAVMGSKEQVDSKDAKTFLESYKLPEKATTEAPPAPDKDK